MTVRELLDELKDVPPDTLVVLSRDGEGNSFSPLSATSDYQYRAENNWSGEIGPEKLTPELEAAGYSDEDIIDDGVPCIVLWPTN